MPFFSFVIQNKPSKEIFKQINKIDIKLLPNIKYFSKDSNLWRALKNNKLNKNTIVFKQEKREKILSIKKNILFCLPPSMGLGDAIEYALAIKSITNNIKLNNYGIAFIGRNKIIFSKYFKLKNIYEYVISEKDFKLYDTIFHFTLEINQLKFQKYIRSNIERSITSYFKVPFYRFKNKKKPREEIEKLTIFPISSSPIRTMPIDLLKYIISNLSKKYSIEVIFDKSPISNYFVRNLSSKLNFKKKFPNNLETLINLIRKIDFGIFMDSGPLHVAKINHIRGILIISSVKKDTLLSGFKGIKSIKSNYKSNFCNGPCGLTNVINYENKTGCYDSLKVKKDIIINSDNLKKFQRGNLKNNYESLLNLPVNCLKKLNNKKVVEFIENNINNSLC